MKLLICQSEDGLEKKSKILGLTLHGIPPQTTALAREGPLLDHQGGNAGSLGSEAHYRFVSANDLKIPMTATS